MAARRIGVIADPDQIFSLAGKIRSEVGDHSRIDHALIPLYGDWHTNEITINPLVDTKHADTVIVCMYYPRIGAALGRASRWWRNNVSEHTAQHPRTNRVVFWRA